MAGDECRCSTETSTSPIVADVSATAASERAVVDAVAFVVDAAFEVRVDFVALAASIPPFFLLSSLR